MGAYAVWCFLLICCICWKSAPLVSAVVANEQREDPPSAIEAKQQYEGGGDHEAFRRLQSAVGDERRLSRLLTWIDDNRICLKRGKEAGGACYALNDFRLEDEEIEPKARWFHEPYSVLPSHTKRWYEHLYNSVLKILLMEQDQTAPILLATKGSVGTSEIYNAGTAGIGDAKTFRKTNTNGRKVSDMTLDVNRSLNDMQGTVHEVLVWIKRTCDEESE